MAIDRFAVREVLFGDINDKQYGALLKSERLSLASAPQQFQDKYESGHKYGTTKWSPWNKEVADCMSAILASFWEDLDFGNIDAEAAFKVLTILENVDGQDRYRGTSLIKKPGTYQERQKVGASVGPTRYPHRHRLIDIANHAREVEAKAHQAIKQGDVFEYQAWADYMKGLAERYGEWSGSLFSLGLARSYVPLMPYDEAEWNGRAERMKLHEGTKEFTTYRSGFMLLKFPKEIQARATKSMRAERNEREHRCGHTIPPPNYFKGIATDQGLPTYFITYAAILYGGYNQKQGCEEIAEEKEGGILDEIIEIGVTWVFDEEEYVYGDEWVYVPHLAVRPVQTSDDEVMAEVDWEKNAGKIAGEYLRLFEASGPVEREPDEL
jgi:hypothetical protein